jgi:hypothetical protein
MKFKTKLKIAVALACVAFSPTAQAADPFIEGVILMGVDLLNPNVGDGVTFNGPLATATQVDTWTGAIVIAATGDFAGTSGAVSFPTPWIFANSYTPFWTVGAFSFDLTNSMITQGPGFLEVKGTGMLHATGFSDTPGFWVFTATGFQDPQLGNNTLFSWSSSTNSVPDGGSTVALLGLSLLGLHSARRKFIKR